MYLKVYILLNQAKSNIWKSYLTNLLPELGTSEI